MEDRQSKGCRFFISVIFFVPLELTVNKIWLTQGGSCLYYKNITDKVEVTK